MALLDMIRANPLEMATGQKGEIMQESQAAVAAITPAPIVPISSMIEPAPAPIAPAETIMLSGTAFDGTRITPRLDAGRIYLAFERKPDRRTLGALKGARFWYDGSSYEWHQRDSEQSREFLRVEFGIRFAAIATPEAAPLAEQTVKPVSTSQAKLSGSRVVPALAGFTLPPDMERYKLNVDGLLLALTVTEPDGSTRAITPSELMIVAIQHLHNDTFEG